MQTPIDCTLGELVQGISALTNDEYEVLASVVLLVKSGQVRLRGPCADTPLTMSTASLCISSVAAPCPARISGLPGPAPARSKTGPRPGAGGCLRTIRAWYGARLQLSSPVDIAMPRVTKPPRACRDLLTPSLPQLHATTYKDRLHAPRSGQ